MARLILLFLLLILSANAQEDYAKKGVGWQAWQKLSKTILANKEKEAIDLCSGRMKEGFEKFGMENIIREVQEMKPEFIREFPNSKGDTLYLVADVRGTITTLIFKKQNHVWLFDEQTPGNFTSPQEADKWPEIHNMQKQLKNIAIHVATHFTQRGVPTLITDLQSMKSTIPYSQNYINPQTGDKELFRIVQGVHYKGASDLLLAVNSKPVFGKFYGCFEDGHIEAIPASFIQENEQAFGINKNFDGIPPKLKKDLEAMIQGLAAAKYQERKKAKEQLIAQGPKILSYLKSIKEHEDLEVRLSIKEILEQLSQTKTIIRPRFKRKR